MTWTEFVAWPVLVLILCAAIIWKGTRWLLFCCGALAALGLWTALYSLSTLDSRANYLRRACRLSIFGLGRAGGANLNGSGLPCSFLTHYWWVLEAAVVAGILVLAGALVALRDQKRV